LSVFVLDKRKRPVMPCCEERARLHLERGQAVVHRRYRFTICLKDRVRGDVEPARVKLDPGSRTIAVVADEDGNKPATGLCLFELAHRGWQISEALATRRAFGLRGANLRYRPPRLDNTRRPQGSLAPSLQHRADTCSSWRKRFDRMAPVSAPSVKRVRFDMQLLENPEILGVEYQQATLAGYEIREHGFAKFGRDCTYCGITDVPLNLDHIHPRSRGGSNRVSHLVPACIPCNTANAARPLDEFLAAKPLARIKARAPVGGAAAVNTTRWGFSEALADAGLPLEASPGAHTKFNPSRLKIPKTHALDAACVGKVGLRVGWQQPTLAIKASARENYCRTKLTAHGFPRGDCRSVRGLQTGDMVRAGVQIGKKAGTHIGRVAVRRSGSFRVGNAEGINARYCKLLHRADGDRYARQPALPPRPEERGFQPRRL
jgi:5-methylcytosine-specific restriction endonuclease McrA